MELLAAVGVFFLVRAWLRQCGNNHRILLRSLLAAAVVWLSPAMMINSHGRPGTDVWIVPFYVWALWASVCNRWMLSGFIVATGAMFKGQQMIVCPVFVLWPLFMGRPVSGLRWLCGLILGLGVWVSPWMLTRWTGSERVFNNWALVWVTGSCLLCLFISFLRGCSSTRKTMRFVCIGIVGIVLAIPAILTASVAWSVILVTVGLGLAANGT